MIPNIPAYRSNDIYYSQRPITLDIIMECGVNSSTAPTL